MFKRAKICEQCVHFIGDAREQNGKCLYLNIKVARTREACSAGKLRLDKERNNNEQNI